MRHQPHRNAILPPPIVENMTLDEWFVGCALMNPGDLAPDDAVIYARGAMRALKSVNVPQRVEPPSEEEMNRWIQIINRFSQTTLAPMRSNYEAHATTIPATLVACEIYTII